MIKRQQFSLEFKFAEEAPKVKVDVLPCKFKNDQENINRSVYFDPCTKVRGDGLKEVNLQGRKMVGREVPLENYKGVVFAVEKSEFDPESMERRVKLS